MDSVNHILHYASGFNDHKINIKDEKEAPVRHRKTASRSAIEDPYVPRHARSVDLHKKYGEERDLPWRSQRHTFNQSAYADLDEPVTHNAEKAKEPNERFMYQEKYADENDMVDKILLKAENEDGRYLDEPITGPAGTSFSTKYLKKMKGDRESLLNRLGESAMRQPALKEAYDTLPDPIKTMPVAHQTAKVAEELEFVGDEDPEIFQKAKKTFMKQVLEPFETASKNYEDTVEKPKAQRKISQAYKAYKTKKNAKLESARVERQRSLEAVQVAEQEKKALEAQLKTMSKKDMREFAKQFMSAETPLPKGSRSKLMQLLKDAVEQAPKKMPVVREKMSPMRPLDLPKTDKTTESGVDTETVEPDIPTRSTFMKGKTGERAYKEALADVAMQMNAVTLKGKAHTRESLLQLSVDNLKGVVKRHQAGAGGGSS